MKTIHPMLASLVLCCLFWSPACADSITILSTAGATTGLAPISGGSLLTPQAIGIEFVLGQEFKDVSISVPGFFPSIGNPTIWLTNGIGSGATPANVIASAQFGPYPPVPPLPPLSDPVFTGLDLSADTYFLIASNPPSGTSNRRDFSSWTFFFDPTITSAPTAGLLNGYLVTQGELIGCGGIGGTCNGNMNFDFPPGSNWDLSNSLALRGGLSVDITGTPVSEPSSAALLATALLALGLLLRKGENRDCDGAESASSNCCKACCVRQRT